MLRYEQVKRDRKKFLALTGITPKEFKILLPAFAKAYKRVHPANQTHAGKARQRALGGGCKGSLDTLEQKLLFALVYQKTYPLQVLLGEVFDLSQPRTNYWIHHLLPVLKQALDDLGLLPERAPQQFSVHEKRQGESSELVIDGTERRRQRPKDVQKQALHYSGQKKTHTDKNVVITNLKTKRVGYLSQTYAGKTNDKKVADTENIAYPRQSTLYKDTGFQGYEPNVAETHQPKKSHAKRS
jgi:hypothetical protein